MEDWHKVHPMDLLQISTKENKKEGIQVTDTAAVHIGLLSQQLSEAKGKFLRVFVQGGGCSGFTYNFKFDDKRPTDIVLEKNGAHCIMDPNSAALLDGATIDYLEGLTGAGFTVKNPNAKSTCGCGSSFGM